MTNKRTTPSTGPSKPLTHPLRPTDSGIDLHEGRILARYGDQTCELEGLIRYEIGVRLGVRYSGCPSNSNMILAERCSIEVPELNLLARGTIYDLGAVSGSVDGRLLGETWVGDTGTDVYEVRFFVPNFIDYIGRFVSSPTEGSWAARLVFGSDLWRIELDQRKDYREAIESVRNVAGFALTHTGRLTRADGAPFRLEAAKPVLECLYFFLSFARGKRVGPLLPVGLSEGSVIWQRWETPWIDPLTPAVHSWFPTVKLDSLGEAFGGFLARWSENDEAIRTLVHWYTAANQHAGGQEGGLLLAQAALELLVDLVAGPSKGTAAEAFRSMLEALGLCSRLPTNPELASVSASLGGSQDGPGLIATVRNAYAHPVGHRRKQVRPFTGAERRAVRELAVQYIELVVLRWLNYNGHFVDRLQGFGIRAGSEVLVPWCVPVVEHDG